MPVLGGTPTQLVGDIDSAPTFSPDGQQISFVRGILDPPANQILIANSDGSGERVLATRKGFAAGAGVVSWSSFGKILAFISPETRDSATRWAMQTISAATGAARRVPS